MTDAVRCHRCDADVRPLQTIEPGAGMVDVCPHCSVRLAAPAPMVAPALALVEATPAAPKRRAVRKAAEPTTPAPKRGIVDTLRKRLAKLDARIAKARADEAEAAQIRRMLAAATALEN